MTAHISQGQGRDQVALAALVVQTVAFESGPVAEYSAFAAP